MVKLVGRESLNGGSERQMEARFPIDVSSTYIALVLHANPIVLTRMKHDIDILRVQMVHREKLSLPRNDYNIDIAIF